MHSSLSSVAQFWQAALVGRERLLGGDVGHLLLLAVHHLHLHLLLHRSAACARQTQVGLYFQPSPPVQELLLSRVRMGKDEKKRERHQHQLQHQHQHQHQHQQHFMSVAWEEEEEESPEARLLDDSWEISFIG